MATAEQCDCHGDCGFAAFRRNAKWPAIPLPENGDCGIHIDSCGRRRIKNGDGNLIGIDVPINHFGPRFDNEREVGLNY